MIRRCDGTDPFLVREDPPWDPSEPLNVSERTLAGECPCDCGLVFDDAERMVIYPHPEV